MFKTHHSLIMEYIWSGLIWSNLTPAYATTIGHMQRIEDKLTDIQTLIFTLFIQKKKHAEQTDKHTK